MNTRRIAFNKVLNLRDLGGYPTHDGKITNFKTFLRSDDLSGITNDEIKFLKDYGLTTVIDLRGSVELKRAPSPLNNEDGIDYIHLPLIDDAILEASGQEQVAKDTLASLYIGILENKDKIKTLIELLANKEGTILFNCSAGKDRTGVTAALLLAIANVGLPDILADYQITYVYLKKRILEIMKQFPEMPQHMLESRIEWMEAAFNHINDNYGSIKNYLATCNIDENTLNQINEKFISKQ